MQVFMLGRVRVAQLMAVYGLRLWGLGGQLGRNWHSLIGLTLYKVA